MKTLGILFTLMFAAAFMPTKGYSNFNSSLENHSEKMYVEPLSLYFADEGIFLKIRSDEWRPISHICHDGKGYYLAKATLSQPKINSAKNSKEKQEKIWVCPKCSYENTSINGVCENCLFPLYEWDW